MGGENRPLEDILAAPADYEASAVFWFSAVLLMAISACRQG